MTRLTGSTELTIGPRGGVTLAVADVRARLACELSGRSLRLPGAFRPFLSPGGSVDVDALVRLSPRLEPLAGEPLFDSKLHWRALRSRGDVYFELTYPPTGALYCRMRVNGGFTEAEILFDERAWLGLGGDASVFSLPHPLDQLLLAPALALRGACLLHACGAVLEGEAMVFAGHSGEGKTTLARLLAEEGVELLSDERVALRPWRDGFAAYGTPWPGEGNVVSTARRPLGGLFVLRKAERHALAGSSPSLAPELAARAIVPYYLPQVASRALAVIDAAASFRAVRELRFARASGLRSFLEAAPA